MPKTLKVTDPMGNIFTLDLGEIEGTELISEPPIGGQYRKVTNLYIELIDGNPKLRVEYNE